MDKQNTPKRKRNTPPPKTSSSTSKEQPSLLSDEQAEKLHQLNQRLPTIDILRPHTRFGILKSLKDQGISFVNTKTGKRILGLPGDYDTVGLVFEPQNDHKETTVGFLTLDKDRSKTKKEPDTFEIDALLFFEHQEEDFSTGYIDFIKDKFVYLFYLEVWNDLEIEKWQKIIEKVVQDMTVDIDGQAVPLAKFRIKTLFVPDNPTETSRMVLKIMKDPSYVNALSGEYHNPDDEEYYEEDKK